MSSNLKSTLLLVLGVALGAGALFAVSVYQPAWLGLETGAPAGDGKAAEDQAAKNGDGDGDGEEEREILYWVAPMDPSYKRDEPGKSPMGMDLEPVYADEAAGEPGTVEVSPAVVNSLGVKTAEAERRTLSRTLRTVGTVGYDERKVSHIHTRVEGWVEKLHVDAEGDRVAVDDPILEIYSPELVTAQEEYLLALRRRDRLGGGDGSPAESMVRQARERLLFYGVSRQEIDELERSGEIQPTVVLRAPHAGVVTELGVREGMRVTPENNLYTVADLSSVWVMADIYAYQGEWVAKGDPVTLELPFYPGRQWEGKVEYVYPYMDPQTRTVHARLVFDNPDGVLKPEMFATAIIHADPKEDVVAVPSETVIRTGKREVVVTALGEGRFRPVEVQTGVESGEWVEVRKGLAAGEQVVTSGQFLIDSESDLGAGMERMEDGEQQDMEGMDHGDMDNGSGNGDGEDMDHDSMNGDEGASGESMDHENMDHESMEEGGQQGDAMDHEGMDHEGHSMEDMSSAPETKPVGATAPVATTRMVPPNPPGIYTPTPSPVGAAAPAATGRNATTIATGAVAPTTAPYPTVGAFYAPVAKSTERHRGRDGRSYPESIGGAVGLSPTGARFGQVAAGAAAPTANGGAGVRS
ncbi:efflux RND transporter periplasmic adaptor subunit [Thiohalorhabdus denitrificans]|uniref:Barrel-sandwich domain of CusB or HlyD membrane-fusion n=1 Tax=Thiohalorhabdus denitrificans TaxID=381306 RepID=A0A1G5CP99_9GAMM|nr:efflux RND transporter periplasmic adaptor subunit [Thiohalorhabdus denitrificans]SCY04108.1 Barrel-sandwich domain of CusB or HlyD membrane-fusion [Thiohalorhabdus denitrificans]